ncbi:MAG: hypothetical protein NZ958_08390 [Bacteroidia bacterium]|nr:hypothetical protein [Bacteroidia bacterium]MDW8088499.1 hypothetical protein [Bacteroidia bacterium]
MACRNIVACLLASLAFSQRPLCTEVLRAKGPWPQAQLYTLPESLWVQADTNGFFRQEGLCPGKHRLQVWWKGELVLDTLVAIPSRLIELGSISRQLSPVVIEARQDSMGVTIPSVLAGRSLEKGLVGVLQTLPCAWQIQAGPLIQKPILEGLRGTRLAYWEGGLPLASQQWGEEHPPELDPLSSEEVIVEPGPSPVRHGCEAIGGVIRLPVPSLSQLPPKQGRFLSGLLWNGRGGFASARLQGRWQNWGYRTQGTLLRLGTLQTPRYFLTGTAAAQAHLSATLERLWERTSWRFFYALYNAQIGIYRGMQVGNLSDFIQAINLGTPRVGSEFSYPLRPPFQTVVHELASLYLAHALSPKVMITLLLGRQFNRRREYDAPSLSNALSGVALDLQLTTYRAELGLEAGTLKAGLFFEHQRNYRQYIYFVPNYRRLQGGFFLLWNRFGWEIGGRVEPLGYAFFRAVHKDNLFPHDTARIFWPWALEVRRSWKGKNQSLNLQAAFLRRAPNVAEMYAYGFHQSQAAFFFGEPALRPENLLALRTTYTRRLLELYLTLFYSPDFVYGVLDEPISSVRGAALPLLYRQGPARWVVFSGRWRVPLSAHWEWMVQGAYLWGEVRELRGQWVPMPLFPPPVLITAALYKHQRWEAQLRWRQVLQQTRFHPRGEYLPPPPGYGLLEAEVYLLSPRWRIGLLAENLLNTPYRAYPDLTRFFAHQPGLQIKLLLQYDFF